MEFCMKIKVTFMYCLVTETNSKKKANVSKLIEVLIYLFYLV